MPDDFSIHPTPDGSSTVYSSRYGQHYHSTHGALTQSRVVYLEGTQTQLHPAPKVLEVGFGMGLNFLTTLRDALERGVSLHYIALEFDPAPAEVLEVTLSNHPFAANGIWHDVLTRWGESFTLKRDGVVLEVVCEDVTTLDLPLEWATAVYLDGFSPGVNPEIWTLETAQKLSRTMLPGGWLSTYSAAGAVKRALEGAGLEIHKKPGIRGKREFITALKPL